MDRVIRIGKTDFEIGKNLYVMAILNVTPDSFSDGGLFFSKDAACECARKYIGEGADIIDIGGESTRPGYTPVSAEEELRRVIPVIEGIRSFSDIPISVDTTKAVVAAAALKAGASLINDVSGLYADENMAGVIAEQGAACCLVHNIPHDYSKEANSEIINILNNDLSIIAKHATDSGINEERIILDPGIGFSKSNDVDFEILKRLNEVRHDEFPLLLACSRKSVFGTKLGYGKEERGEATLCSTAKAYLSGCSFVRVHDVAANRRFIDTMRKLDL